MCLNIRLMIQTAIPLPTFLLSLALTGALAAACGGSAAPAEAPPPAEATEEAAAEEDSPDTAPGEFKKFDDMSPPEKMKHMKTVVAPRMAKVFQEASAEEYEDFSCVTCHGPGAKDGNFEMPSKDLPALDQEEMEEHPEVTQFMKERVVPEMAKLLGEEPYNPETHEGFGCYHCHTKKE